MSKPLATTAIAAVLGLCATALVGPARATYPGATNGRIVALAFPASGAPSSLSTASSYVADVNGGRYLAACRLFSRSYVRVPAPYCAGLFAWGERLFGPWDYRVTGRHGNRWLLERWGGPSWITVRRGRIVDGGW